MQLLEELSIEVTNECTLSCIHCSSGSTPKRLKDELTFLEHYTLIEQARDLGATVVSFSGGNPLLCDHLTKLIDLATDRDYSRILIYTTGHNHMDGDISSWPSVYRVMSNPKVTWIFSLHSDDAKTNDFIMNTDRATAQILNSIAFLIDHNQTVEIHMVPMKPNYKDIPTVRNICGILGVKRMSLLRFVPQTRGKLNKDVLGMSKADFIAMQLIIHEEMLKEHPVEIRLGCPIDFRHAIGLIPEKTKPCHAADDLILVRPNGNVHPCAAWKSLPSDSNVRDHSLSYIWFNSPTYLKIREFKKLGHINLGRVGEQNFDHACSSCRNIDSCKTGCLAQRLHAAESSSLDELYHIDGDPLCPGLPGGI